MRKKYRGSTLLATLLFLALFSLLYLLSVEEYRLTAIYAKNTEKYYSARIIADLFFSGFRELDDPSSSGTEIYNKGIVNYSYKEDLLTMTVKVDTIEYVFTQKFAFEEEIEE